MDKKLQENMPIYVQIMNRVREAVAAGELKPGERVASVREMASDFEVNPNTMQRALNELEREGLLVSERTAGRFVTEDKALISRLRSEMAVDTVDAFRKEMAALGFSDEEMIEFFRKRCEVTGGTFTLERIG
jgi:DNA-binding transcriptional regulator YhcF (GntR family)